MEKEKLRAAAHAQIDTAVAFVLVTVNEAGVAAHANLNGTAEESVILAGISRAFAAAIDMGTAQGFINIQEAPD